MHRLRPATTASKCCRSSTRAARWLPHVRALHQQTPSSGSQEASASRTARVEASRLAQHGRKFSTSSVLLKKTSTAKPVTVETLVAAEDAVVKTSKKGAARIVTLNNPKSLNALNKDMIDLLMPSLQQYEQSPACHLVVLKGEGRGFCAGGDVKAIVKSIQDPKTRQRGIDFFKDEYTLDRYIALMQKPVISFMDGPTMGGGVGLSVHAPFRIATENTVFAMPETDIGLFPDVGASFFLSRLDGQIGTYLGLTGKQLKGYEVFRAGMATHFVPSDRLEALEERLCALEFDTASPSTSETGKKAINAAIEEFVADASIAQSSSSVFTGPIREVLDSAFKHPRVPAILESLEAAKAKQPELSGWIDETIAKLNFVSPTSLSVALQAIRDGKDLDINATFERDLHLASIFCNPEVAPDFVAGVTQRLLAPKEKRKERVPWSPNTIAEIDHAKIRNTFFSAPVEDSSTLPTPPDGSKSYKRYPHEMYALPSEDLIRRVVKGDLPDSGSFALTKEEVIQWFEQKSDAKFGTKEKVEEVLERKTQTAKDGTLVWK